MVAAVHIQGVSKRFGHLQALQNISLQIEEGEFFALLGPNGAGKTTLISSMAGLSRPDAGSIRICGHDVQKDYRLSRRVLGVVPQELVFDPFFNVRQALRLQSGYFGLRNNDAWIDEILENLGLTSKANSNMRALSGGMKRRVMVAQALVHRPPVIVLDEPTAGVDVELRQSLWQFVQQLNRAGHTIILTTHYLEEAETLCNRIAMMKAGQIIALDSKANLLRNAVKRRVQIHYTGVLPVHLAAQAQHPSAGCAIIPLHRIEELEPLLLACRQAGCIIQELEILQADLESVFIETMQDKEATQ